jgi:hypothetical protein
VPITDVHFEEDVPTALRRVSQRMTPYVEAERTADSLVTDWRTTSETVGDGSLILRSRLRFLFETRPDGTEVSVIAQLQSWVIEDNAAPPAVETWNDMDAAIVFGHGLAVVQHSLRARPLVLGEEPIQTFASAAPLEPELADPVLSWSPTNLPPGVATTTETREALLLIPSNETSNVIGQVYDAEVRPTQGRVIGIGDSLQDTETRLETSFRRLDSATELSAAVSYLGLVEAQGSYRRDQTSVVHSTLLQQNRIALPAFAHFDGLSNDAAYYVAGIVEGPSVNLVFTGDQRVLTGTISGEYEGLRAEMSALRARNLVTCQLVSRGYSSRLSCDQQLPPSSQIISELQASAGQAKLFKIVRRIPSRVRPSPATFRVEFRSLAVATDRGGIFEGDIEVDVTFNRPQAPGAPWQIEQRLGARGVPGAR